ncbi:MAG: virulence RhuM family protein [Promicromonosporaceae bacterium]|nr:virulence RhuM family protein [Promicromonosporaceae bacterium]
MSEKPQSEVILYQRSDGAPALEVCLEDETVWLTQAQMVELFQRDKSTISRHIANIFSEGELDCEGTVAEFATVQVEGGRTVGRVVTRYNLDVVISVGYRVKSLQGTRFRMWATQRLREYLVKGFTMDDERLKNLGGGLYWKELLDRIRDIRSSEKVLYRQVLDLYATSVDYNPTAAETIEFFKIVQNKLHYAAHGRTAAEVIAERADAGKPFMGLLSFRGERPVKSEVTVAKNYLDETELRRLNSLVAAYFEAAEFRALSRQKTFMVDWLAQLDRLVVAMEAPQLHDGGQMSRKMADEKAHHEYNRYQAAVAAAPSEVEQAYLEALRQLQHKAGSIGSE